MLVNEVRMCMMLLVTLLVTTVSRLQTQPHFQAAHKDRVRLRLKK